MEGLHPVNRGRRSIPNPKIGFEHPPGLASKRRMRSSAHIRVLPVVRALEDAWSTMQKGGVGRRATSSYFGTVGDPIGRCRSSDRYRAGNTQSVRCKTYGTSAHTSRQARPQTAHSNSRRQNVVETKKSKPNVFIVPSQVVGEVGLACSVPTIERLTKAGAIPSVKLGRLRRYRRADLLALQNEKGGGDHDK